MNWRRNDWQPLGRTAWPWWARGADGNGWVPPAMLAASRHGEASGRAMGVAPWTAVAPPAPPAATTPTRGSGRGCRSRPAHPCQHHRRRYTGPPPADAVLKVPQRGIQRLLLSQPHPHRLLLPAAGLHAAAARRAGGGNSEPAKVASQAAGAWLPTSHHCEPRLLPMRVSLFFTGVLACLAGQGPHQWCWGSRPARRSSRR